MAIVKMNRFTLLAFESHREALLKALQETSLVHFKNLAASEEAEALELARLSFGEELSYAESELAKVSFALSRIEPYYEKPGSRKETPELSFDEFNTFPANYDYQTVCGEIKRLDERIKELKAERIKLKTDNEALSAWVRLDVSTRELETASSVTYMLGSLPRQSADTFLDALAHDYPCSYAELLDPIREDIAALIVAGNEEFADVASLAKTHGFTKISLSLDMPPADVISKNNERITAVEKEEKQAEEDIASQSVHYSDLLIMRDYFDSLAERHRVCGNFLRTKETFLIEGWFAQSDTAAFSEVVSRICGSDCFLEVDAVEKDSEDVPIKLKNNAFISAFEGVTEMYSMPRYNEIDPTPVLTPFYILFFGAMFGDVGYGLVLTIGAAALSAVTKAKGSSKKFYRFFTYLGIASIIMGFMYGSLFGATFFTPLTNEAGESVPILNLTGDIMTILVLSVAVGVVHIFFGLGVKGYMLIRDGKLLDAICDALFWILAVGSMIGLLVTAMLPDFSQYSDICKYILIGSIIALVCTQGRTSKSIGAKIGNGVYSVYSLTGYISDLVSYTRLMALALASTYIAFSFNLMAGLVAGIDNLGEIGKMSNFILLIPAALVAVLGAGLNMGLGALGAYVHSCRLQYVEYFGKFYEGGGVPFKPFETKNSYINISKGGKQS